MERMKVIDTIRLTTLLLTLACLPAQAQERLYRVEILVLAHLDHNEPGADAPRPADYSAALDLLAPVLEPVVVTTETTEAIASPAAEPDPAALPDDATGEADPLACTGGVMHIAEMGPEMQEAWRRLRGSKPFRPLQHLAWQQTGSAPFPQLRIHDDEVVLTEDPWAALRPVDEALAESGSAREGLPEAEGPLPSPIDHYRLDGAVSLARSRFLHLELDIEWREPVYDPTDVPTAVTATGAPADTPGGRPLAETAPTQFRIHALKQRRQVRTNRLEYFDSPTLGVLAYVTRVRDASLESTEAPEDPEE